MQLFRQRRDESGGGYYRCRIEGSEPPFRREVERFDEKVGQGRRVAGLVPSFWPYFRLSPLVLTVMFLAGMAVETSVRVCW